MPTIPSLLGSYIDETYQRLVQVSGSSFADGLGNPITIAPGSVNPTSTYLPFNNAGVFADSYLNQSGGILKTTSASVDLGLKLDFGNIISSLNNSNNIGVVADGSEVRLGNIDGTTNHPFLSVDTGRFISTYDTGSTGRGLGFNFTDRTYKLGEWDGAENGTVIEVNDTNQTIKTVNQGNDIGLKLDFGTGLYQFGDWNGNGGLVVDNSATNEIILFNSVGLSLLGSSRTAILGDFGDSNKGTKLVIDDATQTITITGSLNTTGSVSFTSLTSSPQSNVVTIDTITGQLYYTASSAIGGGGSGTPGGSNTQIQFNGNGAFSGSSALTFNSGSNTLTLTGSLNITGSLTVTQNISASSFTGSLFGTATTSSYVLQAVSASFATLAQTSNTASYVVTAQTASYVLQAVSASFATLAQTSNTASYVVTAQTASYVTSSNIVGTVLSASYALTSSVASSVVGATPTEIGYLSGLTTNTTNIDDWHVTKGFQAMGSAIKGTNLSIVSPSLINASTGLSTGTLRMTTAYLPKPTTITGVKWYAQAIATSYTSTNYTGVGLYTSTAGTLTCVASCSNNPNMVSSSNFTAASWISQSFGSTYSAQPGLYYVGIVLGFSVATPSPTLSTNTLSSGISVNIFNMDFTNSNKFNGTLTGQTTMPNSIALSSLTAASSVNHGLWLY